MTREIDVIELSGIVDFVDIELMLACGGDDVRTLVSEIGIILGEDGKHNIDLSQIFFENRYNRYFQCLNFRCILINNYKYINKYKFITMLGIIDVKGAYNYNDIFSCSADYTNGLII